MKFYAFESKNQDKLDTHKLKVDDWHYVCEVCGCKIFESRGKTETIKIGEDHLTCNEILMRNILK